jgi:hypothetical protein
MCKAHDFFLPSVAFRMRNQPFLTAFKAELPPGPRGTLPAKSVFGERIKSSCEVNYEINQL